MNIWQSLPKPFFVLAPMDDVTDTVFRRIVAQCARPDLMFTEFANADGLNSSGRSAVLHKLHFTKTEQPLIAQLWGMKPENYLKATEEIVSMGFAGVDINLGCPVPKIVKLGACSALINNRPLAAEIIAAAKQGTDGKIPVSVKTRPGFGKVDLSWTQFLLEQNVDALSLHGRTAKQQSKVPNDWDLINEVRKQRDELAPNTILVGNGDIVSRSQGEKLAAKYKLDGLMIGRGIFKDPYLFAKRSPWPKTSKDERLALFSKHIKLFIDTWGDNKNPASLKKFAKVYVNGFDGASELRTKIMETQTAKQLLSVLVKH